MLANGSRETGPPRVKGTHSKSRTARLGVECQRRIEKGDVRLKGTLIVKGKEKKNQAPMGDVSRAIQKTERLGRFILRVITRGWGGNLEKEPG